MEVRETLVLPIIKLGNIRGDAVWEGGNALHFIFVEFSGMYRTVQRAIANMGLELRVKLRLAITYTNTHILTHMCTSHIEGWKINEKTENKWRQSTELAKRKAEDGM